MFTGIVEEVGTIEQVIDQGGDIRLRVRAEAVLADIALGDSIALSGCCLTVVAFDQGAFEVELSKETIAKTAPRWRVGAQVNLERALQASGRFGGHIVTGHIEGVGTVLDVKASPGAYIITVRAPEHFAPYLIDKGSITVDGVSLTLVKVGQVTGSSDDLAAHEFTLWIIPHTLEITTLGELQSGSDVNLEADVLAKYIERMMQVAQHAQHNG